MERVIYSVIQRQLSSTINRFGASLAYIAILFNTINITVSLSVSIKYF